VPYRRFQSRFGRNPYEHGWKSASKMGSSTSYGAQSASSKRTASWRGTRAKVFT
jgi:hypothetical protein